ncbi:MAG: asparagine synthase (glutamine-hydrolyzing) [Bacteroidales bacterium]
MCGIAGIYNFKGNKPIIPSGRVENMLKAIRHRGPDESGIYTNNNLGIGNVRLSIIDLNTGQQPLSIRDKRYWIVYNGELFNYIELKEKLIKIGIDFFTDCDTEVVIQCFAEYGADCLNLFNGQFAFAIWDNQKKELFMARDRVGIRPLFYTIQNGSIYFCSEIKGLFENHEIKRKISLPSLSQIFTFWTTITPNTPFDDIYELPPGHYLHLSNKKINIQKYWSLPFPAMKNISTQSLDALVDHFCELFYDSVRIRLRADVEVAAYLSGGIDSSITTAFIKKIEPSVLNTYSIGFDDEIFDETKYQLESAYYFKTNHKAFSCTKADIGNNFFNTVYHTEFLFKNRPNSYVSAFEKSKR